jgi:hypothetical protein
MAALRGAPTARAGSGSSRHPTSIVNRPGWKPAAPGVCGIPRGRPCAGGLAYQRGSSCVGGPAFKGAEFPFQMDRCHQQTGPRLAFPVGSHCRPRLPGGVGRFCNSLGSSVARLLAPAIILSPRHELNQLKAHILRGFHPVDFLLVLSRIRHMGSAGTQTLPISFGSFERGL